MRDQDTHLLEEAYTSMITEMPFGTDHKGNNITVQQFIDNVQEASTKGVRPISFTSVTTPSMNVFAQIDGNKIRTPYPKDKVFKISQVNGMMGSDYEASVNRQRGREDMEQDFQAQDRKWGEREGNIIQQHGKSYLRIHPKSTTTLYVVIDDQGNAREINKQELSPWLRPSSDAGATQGVTDQIIHRNYGMSNIAMVSMNGEENFLSDNQARLFPIIEPVLSKLK